LQNPLSLWSELTIRRRIVVIGATLAMFAAVLGLSRMAQTPSMALLYSGLDSASAGEVVRALEQAGVAYRVQGDAISVDSSQRDSLRMTLAAQGLPATGGAGYELLDSLSGFGTTSQMFDAAYWRAKEGELARTIVASPQIKAARVHIAQAAQQIFRRDQHATASVTVTTIQGTLPPSQAKALKFLVASAVAGLTPEDVAVIDSVGGLIQSGDEAAMPGSGADERALELKRNVERLLAARVGPGKAVVEVSVDLVTERESIVEHRFDPDGRVAISTETEERTNSTTDGQQGVTVASNLPTGDAGTGSTAKSQGTETRERVNFEVSETQRELVRAPGAIRKQSVAVLIDGILTTAADGTVAWQPRTEEELSTLRELVASAVGLDAARGDVITLKTLEFEPVPEAGTLVEAGMLAGVDIMSSVQVAVLAIVALILGLFVVRPALMSARSAPADLSSGALSLPLPGSGGQGAASDAGRVLTGEIDDGMNFPAFSVISQDDPDEDASEPASDPVARLRRLIEARQAESVEILRGWMEDREEVP
jgi:flagellar M-ring protein FliF